MPEITRVETLYRGYLKLFGITLREDGGAEVTQQVEDHGRAAVLLAYDPERRTALLVSVPRPAVRYAGHTGEFLEPIAGMIEDGESAEAAIRREAMEEAGLRIGRPEKVAKVFASPGVSTETLDLYLVAYALGDLTGKGGGEAGEHVRMTERSLGSLWALTQSEGMLDGKLLMLLQALQLRRPELFEGSDEALGAR